MSQPETNVLDPNTTLGHVHLTVSDLERSLNFYQAAIGLHLHRQSGDTAYLGAGEHDLVVLTATPGAVKSPRTTGLYHFALLVPSRPALAHALQRLVDHAANLTGGADHGVSEALYLDDPDGNGIELYRDRPRSEWPHTATGELAMTTDPLDVEGILALLEGAQSVEPKMRPGTVLGHMHLHVAQLAEAVEFYRQVIGLELQMLYGRLSAAIADVGRSAAFLSAGGYHHHLGLNTWNGVGAPPPPSGSVGLRHFTVRLTGQDEIAHLLRRLEAAQIPYERRDEGLFLRDPAQNGVLFTLD